MHQQSLNWFNNYKPRFSLYTTILLFSSFGGSAFIVGIVIGSYSQIFGGIVEDVTKPAFSTSIQHHNVYQLLFITCHGVSLVFSSALLYVNRFKLHAFPSHFHKRRALKWNYKCVTFSSYHSLLLKQHLFIIKVGNLCIETKPEALKRSYLESTVFTKSAATTQQECVNT